MVDPILVNKRSRPVLTIDHPTDSPQLPAPSLSRNPSYATTSQPVSLALISEQAPHDPAKPRIEVSTTGTRQPSSRSISLEIHILKPSTSFITLEEQARRKRAKLHQRLLRGTSEPDFRARTRDMNEEMRYLGAWTEEDGYRKSFVGECYSYDANRIGD
ncbi:hypothetical protein BJ508DRAFT_373149 [Ascobolus immersus RN42]|uniref:Uncharacterized protein n=1 Tax=Ascobolus immersus RN42 TaxID=1160509 RepID=A0A3N4IKJ9_ASCIM|nr:hypothetical protein BJ508DRAFT_373149 [Ascobolus immersus RN42]